MRHAFPQHMLDEYLREPPGPPLPNWSVERHIEAYRHGFFPMADPLAYLWDGREVRWYNADPRAVLPLREEEGLHVPRTIRKRIRRSDFAFRTDRRFRDVVLACAKPRSADDLPWINGRILKMFTLLHEAGWAHSFEAWRRDPQTGEEALVGGVYGLAIGAAFFAESMFHVPRPRRADGSRHPLDGTDASTTALIALVQHLQASGFSLIDVQMTTAHTERLGATELPRETFLERLADAASAPPRWSGLPN